MYTKAIKSYKFYTVALLVPGFFFSAVLLLVSCNTQPAEHYGFITTLGSDTIAVESMTRQGNTITGDAVDRFPVVRVRHTVIELNEDGSIRHLVMDIHTPSEPADQRDRKVVADVANNTVHISKTDGTGTLKRDFATGGSIVVAHVPQMYSLYELYFAAALKQAKAANLAAGSTVQMRQFYIDREFDRFPLGRARVQLPGDGRAEITHDWLSGTGEAIMDSGYHMLSYSGARTTYKVKVNRLALPPDIKSLAGRFEALETKAGALRELSVRDTLHATIGNVLFTIDYGRPLMRGRQLLGDVIPYDRIWRTGANAATQFTTSASVKIGGMQVPAGTYTLFTAPHTNGTDLIVNRQSGQWGTEYNGSRNLGMVKLTTEALPVPVEAFTISIVPTDTHHGTLAMEWGTFRWAVPIEVP